MEDCMETDFVPQLGYLVGLLNSVHNTWIPEINGEVCTSPADNECPNAEQNESSDINNVLSLPNMRVSIDDLSDAENEVQSEPVVIRSINEQTGECSEQYEQNDENIFSSFKQMDTGEVSSENSCLMEGETSGPMEQSVREYCADKTTQMFKPRIGMTFDSLTEAYQFYNSYSWVLGFSIRFVAQYSKLINDRESSDHECDKNKKHKSIELQVGYPIEKHASLIYTRKVYQLFKMEFLKSTTYVIVPRKEKNIFEVKHVQAELRYSWCKVNYVIDVQDPVVFYKSECGLYEHFGIVCSHIIAVFIHRGVCSIPDCHIMKRWTRTTRMSKYNPNLRNLAKDRRMESRSFRHKVVYISAMELVNQAEVDEKSCEIANRNIERGKKEIEEYRLSKLTTCQVGYGDCSGTSNAADADGADDTMDCTEVGNPGLEIFDRSKNIGIPVCSIKAPLIKKKDGRPTKRRFLSRLDANIKNKKPVGKAKRSKDPGGLSEVVQSRFYNKCKSPAHNLTGYPKIMLEDGPN